MAPPACLPPFRDFYSLNTHIYSVCVCVHAFFRLFGSLLFIFSFCLGFNRRANLDLVRLPMPSSSSSPISTPWLASPRLRHRTLCRRALLERGGGGGIRPIRRYHGHHHLRLCSGRQVLPRASAAGGAESVEDKAKDGSSNVSRPEHRERNWNRNRNPKSSLFTRRWMQLLSFARANACTHSI